MPEPKRIAERYDITDELGRGGFAVVYRARDTRMEREVALKVIVGNFTDEPSFVERFRLESRTAANLRHPNIVPVYDFGEADGMLYLAMALIGEGQTLDDLLEEQAPLALEHAIAILTPLAGALDYLHQQDAPLTHRDVKPANVLLGGDVDRPWVVLTDFGLVRSLQVSTALTQTGAILGTPAYMAPEQADAKQWGEVTPLTDVYALGVVAYQMLTGRAPFEGGMATVLHAHAYEPPPSPLELLPDLGDDLSAVLLRALRKPPAERHPSAGDFVGALQTVAETWTAAAQREATLEQLEAQAKELLQAGEWLEALDRCTQMVRLDPNRPAALEMLTAAKQGLDREQAAATSRRRLEERYAEGVKLLDQEKWKEAIAAFEDVTEGNPDFRDVQEKLTSAKDERERARWYGEATAHAEAERWAEACRALVRVLRGRTGYRDGDAAEQLLDATEGLLSRYDELADWFGWSRRALPLYEELALAVERGKWQEAVAAGEELSQLVPDLQGVQAWVHRAQEQLQAEEAPPKAVKIPLQRARAEPEPEADATVRARDGKEMVRIPAGRFLYGEPPETRRVAEFWIDKTPVTNAEYARFVSDTDHTPPRHWNGKSPSKTIADHPVVNVSWRDAVAYAKWAGKRLPTEEEWEKAARGTDGRKYPWGDKGPSPKVCNFNRNEGGTTPVGKYFPRGDSPYGCMDMAGNVWEWTASEHDAGGKVLRGGSYLNFGDFVDSTFRLRSDPDDTENTVGFRCVKDS
jgi:formylglycine-generating enzyme required for sulfatase activity